MAGCFHLVSNNAPGCMVYDRNYLPCQAVTGRAVSGKDYACHENLKLVRSVSIVLGSSLYAHRRAHIACAATSYNNRRSHDFARQNRGFSKGKSKQHQGYESFEDIEESELPTSRPRNQTTPSQGARDRKIFELFKKVRAKLREQQLEKEEEAGASQQVQPCKRETVDAILDLLRKRPTDRANNNSVEEECHLSQQRRSKASEDEGIVNYMEPGVVSDEYRESNDVIFGRPASDFRRRSPVPEAKFQPSMISANEERTSDAASDHDEPDSVVASLDEVPFAVALDSEASDNDKTYRDDAMPLPKASSDLMSLKVTELRELARSRGFKGYSKLKKDELVGLLSEDGP